jgi:DNA adenine methylase
MNLGGVRPKPFVKWAGGKRQIIDQLLKRVPPSFRVYFEPFLGGGALLFELMPRRAVVGDVNYELINAYRVIRDRVEELIEDLKRHRNDREYYYRMRSTDPNTLDPVRRASRFIYLNKTCYNGLWRVNSRGEFNVPFGRHARPKICDEENLRAVSEYLRSADIRILHCDYRETLKTAGRGDFVYLDPPYAPVSETARFTHYVSGGFSEKDQLELAEVFRDLDSRGCYVMLSNSDTPLVRDLYGDFLIEEVRTSRFINCVATRRSDHRELIIRNYG